MKKDLHKETTPQSTIPRAWNQPQKTVIDVRSPSEYQSGTIPGAVNVPLLSNTEKSTIGLLYKQFGPNAAIDRGYDLLEAKLDHFKEMFAAFPREKEVIVFCARGGMRSTVVTNLLRSFAFNASQMTGGYKQFRRWNLKKLDEFSLNVPIIIHGKTGVGKTRVLNLLENSLDLEGLAQHRGSLFGAIGKQPVSQKRFEADLLMRLEALDNSRPIYIEGESRKIGEVFIPNSIFKQMRSAAVILLESSIETRVERTVEEYIVQQPHSLPVIRQTIEKLTRDLGKKSVSTLLDNFDQGDYQRCFQRILEKYYDRKYSHSMRGLTYERVVSSEELDVAVREIEGFRLISSAAG